MRELAENFRRLAAFLMEARVWRALSAGIEYVVEESRFHLHRAGKGLFCVKKMNEGGTHTARGHVPASCVSDDRQREGR